ncbi:MAG: hypothetical protein Edafosvirus42_8, partial [Edafosvirus sp.]
MYTNHITDDILKNLTNLKYLSIWQESTVSDVGLEKLSLLESLK